MNISIVIPNYNGEELLKRNIPKVIEALDSYKSGKKEIIVTDDASHDNSIAVLKVVFDKNSKKDISFVVLQNSTGKNRGFSGNVNEGVRAATGDIVILLNTDVEPHKNFLQPLLSHFSNPNVFAVGCMDESIEDGKTVLRGRGIGTWKRGFLVHGKGEPDRKDTLWVSGGSGAFRKSLWVNIGGLNELYNPFYWEDIDLSYRAQKCGYEVLFEKGSIVVHYHAKGAIKKHYKSFQIKTIAYRNQIFFTWLNATDTMLIVSHLFWLPYHIINTLLQRDIAFTYGLFLAILSLGRIFTYRARLSKKFIKSDKEIISEVGE